MLRRFAAEDRAWKPVVVEATGTDFSEVVVPDGTGDSDTDLYEAQEAA